MDHRRPDVCQLLAGRNTTVGSATANFVLRDGVLAWFYNSGLKVSTVTSTVTLSSASASAATIWRLSARLSSTSGFSLITDLCSRSN